MLGAMALGRNTRVGPRFGFGPCGYSHGRYGYLPVLVPPAALPAALCALPPLGVTVTLAAGPLGPHGQGHGGSSRRFAP